jgi:hypothetical protein
METQRQILTLEVGFMIHINKSFLLALSIIAIHSAAAMAQSTDTTGMQNTGTGTPQPDIQTYSGRHARWYGEAVPVAPCRPTSSPPDVYFTATPSLQGATMGTIGPQGTDATQVQGIMTAGTVRVNNLANLEAALNIVAIVALILGHLVGIYYLVKTIRLTVKTPGNVLGGLAKGFSFISVGLVSPMFINWALAAARDAALFN